MPTIDDTSGDPILDTSGEEILDTAGGLDPLSDTHKLSLIHYNQPFQPAAGFSTDGLGTDDLQQLIWQYSNIAWSSAVNVPDTGPPFWIIIMEEEML